MTAVTITAIFHAEGPLAMPALASMQDMVDTARAAGIAVEARAMLDRADDLTRHVVAARGQWLDGVAEVAVGDLGLARNAAAELATGRHLVFLDGDDLWGAEWLRLAHGAATRADAPAEAIWHPQRLFYFAETDFDRHSTTPLPHGEVASFHMQHSPSDAEGFDARSLLLENVWTANAFAPRALHLRHPYSASDRGRGFGIEDWSWNLATLHAGIPHLVVPGTVHLIRTKETDSLGRRNAAEGLLPWIAEDALPGFGEPFRP